LERGGVKTEISYNNNNNNPNSGQDDVVEVLYLQYFPWYTRVFLHTLTVHVNGVQTSPGA
jgi:hypothetical protein